MAFIIKDRVKEGTTSTGTGDITLSGSLATFDTFQSYMTNGDTTYYAIVHTSSGVDEWEVGLGTWNTGNTLTRTTVLAGSNGTSAENFSAGSKDVFMTYPAAHAALAGDDVDFANITVSGTVDGRDVATDGTKLDTVEQNADVTDAINVAAAGALMRSGGTMTGALILNADPTTALGAATKEYVDTIAAAGIHYHTPVRVEAPLNLTVTYNNGTNGVGATLTNAGTQEAITIDGVALSSGDRVLVYEQTDATQNGIYTVTTVGSGSTNWVLTRATDADSYGASDPNALGEGDAYFVKEGATGAGELYVMNTAGTITFGTTAITFTVIAETAVYSGGTGITLTGTTFSIGQDVGTTANVTFNQVTAAIIGNVTGNVTGDVTGNAGTATKLATARNIALSGDVTGNANFDGTGNISITAVVQDDSHSHVISNVDGLQTALNGKTTTARTITAGDGLTGGGDLTANRTLNVGAGSGITVTADAVSHADTSSQGSSNNSGRTYIQDVTLDTFGHVTGLATATETVTDTTYTAGAGLNLSGTVFSHTDTSSQASVNNSNGTVIQDITLDTYGHITGIASTNLDGRYYTETEADSRFVNVTGDTMTGDLTISSTSPEIKLVDTNSFTDANDRMIFRAGGNNLQWQWYDNSASSTTTLMSLNNVGQLTLGANTVFHDGYHPNADTLTTARTINGVSFDGSANITVADSTKLPLAGGTITSGTNTGLTINHDTFANGLVIHRNHGTNAAAIKFKNNTGDTGILFANHSDQQPIWRKGTATTQYKIFNDSYHPNADKWTTARTLSLSGDASGSVSWDGSANASLSVTVANDSHTHAFNNLTGKTSGTGEYSTSSHLVSGRGSGGVALTINDGYGNANVTFNHKQGIPEQNGNAARIEVNTDSATDANMNFEVKSGVTSGTAIQTTSILNLSETQVTAYKTLYENSNRVFTDGYHPNADKWTTARTLSLSGDASGSVSWDGSGNATLSVTVANDSHSHSNYITSNANDIASGRIDFTAGITAQTLDIGVTGDRTIQALASDGSFGSYGDLHLQHYGGNLHMLHGGGTAYIDDNVVWHAGNDGSGSGLDADTVDGIEASSFLRSDANDTASGSYSFTNSYNEFGNSTGSVSNDGSWNARLNLAGSSHARLDVKSVSDGIITTMYSHTGQSAGKVGTFSNHPLKLITNGTDNATLSTAGSLSTTAQGTLWGSSNDGSGSSLDADLLDGVQGSSYLRSDATDTFTNLSGTSLTLGSGVTLQESTDRADLLQITSSTSGWAGLQIRNSSNEGRWSFMTDGAQAGFYDDENSEWAVLMAENGAVNLYHNNVLRLNTLSDGVDVSGTLYVDDKIVHNGDPDTYTEFHTGNQWRVVCGGTERFEVNTTDINVAANLQMNSHYLDMNNNDIYGVDQIFHEGDTDTYMQFHAADQWRVVTGGAERLEVNNSQITSTEPIHAPSFHGDGSALTSLNISTPLTGLPTGTDATGSDLIPVYDASAGTWEKQTITNAALQGPAGATGATGPAGADGAAGAAGVNAAPTGGESVAYGVPESTDTTPATAGQIYIRNAADTGRITSGAWVVHSWTTPSYIRMAYSGTGESANLRKDSLIRLGQSNGQISYVYNQDNWATFNITGYTDYTTYIEFTVGAPFAYAGGYFSNVGAQLIWTSGGVNSWTSGDNTWAAGGTYTLSHSLGTMPKGVQVELVCIVANWGYSVGDVHVLSSGERYANWGVALINVDSTTIKWGVYSNGIIFRRESFNSSGSMLNSQWRVRFTLIG